MILDVRTLVSRMKFVVLVVIDVIAVAVAVVVEAVEMKMVKVLSDQ